MSTTILDEQLAKLAEGVIESAEAAKEFLISELPEVIQQLLTFYFVYYLIIILVGVTFLGVALYSIKVGACKVKKYETEGTGLMCLVLGAIAGLASAGTLVAKTKAFLMVWVAPKLFLIEYVRGAI